MADEGSMIGKVGWIDMCVEDAATMRDFYQAVIGWGFREVDMEGYADYSMTADGEDVAGVCWRKSVNEGVPAGWIPYFVVADLDAALGAARERGATVIDHRQYPSGGVAFLRDPAGSAFALYQS